MKKMVKPGLLADEEFLVSRGLGADLGGNTFKIGETQGLQLLTEKTEQYPSVWTHPGGPPKFAQEIVNKWEELARKSNRKLSDYKHFACAACGPTDVNAGVIQRITNRGSAIWAKVPFRDILRSELVARGVPAPNIAIGNDGLFMVLGEYYAAVFANLIKARETFILATAGTGLAFGAVIEGQAWKGESGLGGEEGHRSCDAAHLCKLAGVDVPIEFPRCPCGGAGVCLEKTPACLDGLIALVRAEIKAGRWPGETKAETLAPALLSRADNGDPNALRIILIQMRLIGAILAEFHRTYHARIYCSGGAWSTTKNIRAQCQAAIQEGFRLNQAFKDPDDPALVVHEGFCGENAAVYGGPVYAAMRAGCLQVLPHEGQ